MKPTAKSKRAKVGKVFILFDSRIENELKMLEANFWPIHNL